MTEQQIITILDKLSIKHENRFKGKYIQILCPNHSDKSFGSCQVYISSVIKCWSCGYVSNLFGLVRKRKPELSSKQIFEFLGENKSFDLLSNYLSERNQKTKRQSKEIFIDLNKVKSLQKERVNTLLYYPFTRFMNRDFCERFEIEIITEGFYKDFFCIPIKYKGEVISYEFRKAKEFEYFEQYYNEQNKKSLEEYRKQFKQELEEIEIPKNNLTNYLRKSKVIYNKQSQLREIIFNIDNLNRNEDLYITEGIAGIPELEYNFKTKNCTALFGSNISEKQVEILSGFTQRKILTMDNDIASDKLISLLNQILDNFWIIDKGILLKTSDYLLQKSGLLENFHIL